jgi:murein DD-endopeptidase MepM/ murein hydrolase activator NlpD
LRIIDLNTQDSDPSSIKGQTTYTRSFQKKFAVSVVTTLFVFGVLVAPLHAGILTFLGGLFGGGELVYKVEKNSQNVALLSPAINIDPVPSKGGGAITITGQTALVADSGPLGTSSNTEVIPVSDQISVYVVREGDSISQIAKMFSVTTETILWANDVGRGGLIKPGQTLVILPVTGVVHEVKKGDTIGSIAKKYKSDTDDIALFNELDNSSALVIGDVLIIPNGKIAQTYTTRQSSPTVLRGAEGPNYNGYYMSPVSAASRSQGLHGYNAVDLATYAGAPIVATAAGEILISRTGWNGGYGNYIVIAHANGTQTVYAHNSQNIVYAGQYVVQGQVIGYVGSTGRSTGAHVHFEVRGAQNPF